MDKKLVTLSNLAEFKLKLMQAVEAEGFVTASVDNLVNYYLKSETYTKSEVDSIVAAIKQFTYETAATLPTASASTMYKIYLIPASGTSDGHTAPAGSNIKKEYITLRGGSGTELDPYTYAWEEIGDTAIDLSGYVTTTALNTILADYTTTANLTTLLAGKQDKIDADHKLSADLLADGTTNKVFTATEKSKLYNIEDGAQVNIIESIKVAEGTADSSETASITNKQAHLLTASDSEIDALFSVQ